MVLPLGTFSPRVDGCNTPGRTQHLQLVDDAGGSAQDDEDEDKAEDEDDDEDEGFYPAPLVAAVKTDGWTAANQHRGMHSGKSRQPEYILQTVVFSNHLSQ